MKMKVLVTERISDNRFKDSNGNLIIRNNVIARTGKQTYKHYQVHEGSDDYDTDIEVDRPLNEVISIETIASFENTPITILHPDEKVTINNRSQLEQGFYRDIRQGLATNPDTGIEEPVLMGTAVVTKAESIEGIENGEWTHWSCGYDTEIVFINGQATQTKIRGNHVALCTTPRAGKITAISDDISKDEIDDPTSVEADEAHVPHFIQMLTDALDSKQITYYLDKKDVKNEGELILMARANEVKVDKLNGEYRLSGFEGDIDYVLDSIGLDFDKDNAW